MYNASMKSHEIRRLHKISSRTPQQHPDRPVPSAQQPIITIINRVNREIEQPNSECAVLLKLRELYRAETEGEINSLLAKTDQEEIRQHSMSCSECKPYVDKMNIAIKTEAAKSAIQRAAIWVGAYLGIGWLKRHDYL
jgi:hypothetical protein